MSECNSGLSPLWPVTTPKHKFTFPSEISSYKRILISYAQRDKVLFAKTEEDLAPGGNEKVGIISLTQEETKLIDPRAYVTIEVRAMTSSGNVPPPKQFTLAAKKVINKEVLTDGA